MTREKSFLSKIKRLFKCDTVRIIALDSMFLVIGESKHTKDDKEAYWTKNGERYDFEYLNEKCIASGRSLPALMKPALEYRRLQKMTMVEYLNEQIERRRKCPK